MICFSLFARIIEPFIESHYVVHKDMIRDLRKFKMKKEIKVLVDPASVRKYEKHESFNVLFYLPRTNNQKLTDWIYGADIIQKIIEGFPELCFIRVDGSQDMSNIYPITDFYLRPNRNDGEPRMIMECKLNNIPYYHSRNNPCVEEIFAKIIKAKDEKI